MGLFKANYWLTLVYNGVVIGIWPAGALAMFISGYPFAGGSSQTFLRMFVIDLMGFCLVIMWLYHSVIWRRRRRGRPR